MKSTFTILEAIKSLSNVCDGAHTKDGQGFAACDVNLKQFSYCSELTKEQQKEFKPLLFKYKGQLGIESVDDLIIENSTITEKVQREEIKKGQILKLQKNIESYGAGKVVVSFVYNADLVPEVKKLQGAKFNWDNKTWTIPVNDKTQADVKRFLEVNGFNVDKSKLKNSYSSEVENPNRVEMKNGKIQFHFIFNQEIIDAVKMVKGRVFSMETKTWSANLTIENVLVVDRIIRQFNFSVPKDVVETISLKLIDLQNKSALMAANLESSSSMSADLEVVGIKGTLRPFQKAGVKYIIENKRVIVGDEMGLGKTLEAIAAIIHTNSLPALVVCPNSLKYNWESEVVKFSDKKTVMINSNTDFSRLVVEEAIYITNYNSLVKHVDLLAKINFKALVSDESHFLKNKKAKRTTCFSELASSVKPELTLLLTGTAIVNRPNELISQLEILGKLDEFGGFWGFAKRYCGAFRDKFGLDISGATNLDELHSKLRSICYIRRNKKDVLTELPPKTWQVIELDINNRAKYNRAKEDLIEYLRKEIDINREFLNSICHLSEEEQKDLKKQWHETKAKNAEQAEHLVKINELKKLVIDGKLNECIEWISEIVDEAGEKLVVFAHHTKVVDAISEHFNCPKINGSVSIEDRNKAVNDFQNNPDVKLIVLNIASGSVGLTLTAASKLAFVEQGWTPGEHDQAEDRIHRIGQMADSANYYYLLGKDTIDIDIFELISKKREVTNAVNKGEFVEKNISIMNELIGKLLN